MWVMWNHVPPSVLLSSIIIRELVIYTKHCQLFQGMKTNIEGVTNIEEIKNLLALLNLQ